MSLNFGSRITIVVRYSAIYKGNDSLYMGVEHDPFLSNEASAPLGVFVAFIYGDENTVFVVPIDTVLSLLATSQSNRLHVVRKNAVYFLRCNASKQVDITDFFNKFPEVPAWAQSITEDENLEDKDSEKVQRLHTHIQHCLIKFGKAAGYQVWVAPQDRNLAFNDEKFSSSCIQELPNYGLNDTAYKIVKNIDVIWLDGETIIRAFEIEATTSIYSGLLRMSDLLVSMSNISFELSLCAASSRRERVREQIMRPTFRVLRSKCSYVTFEEILDVYKTAKEIFAQQWKLRVELEGEKF